MPRELDERIIYVVETEGDEEGRNTKDYPRQAVFASYLRKDAEARAGSDSRFAIVPRVIEVNAAKKAALKKLDPVDVVVLGLQATPKRV
jgi:hypothetical protein